MALLLVQIFKLDKNFHDNKLSDESLKSANLPFYQSLLNIFPSGWEEECGAVEDEVVQWREAKLAAQKDIFDWLYFPSPWPNDQK